MKYPIQDYVAQGKDMLTNFQGLDARLTGCTEGEFFDMKNITTQYYPVLSPRNKRSEIRTFDHLWGILDKEQLISVEDAPVSATSKYPFLFVDGVNTGCSLGILEGQEKTLVKMGAYVAIFPDKKIYNVETKEERRMEVHYKTDAVAPSPSSGGSYQLHVYTCKADGTVFYAHTEDYYKTTSPKSGDVMVTTTSEGKTSFKVYSELTSMWSTITSTYLKLSITGQTFTQLKEGDGIKISLKLDSSYDELKTWLVNDDGDGWFSVNTYIKKKPDDNTIVVTGIINDQVHSYISAKIDRNVPDMSYVVECQNRLWGCSTDGHEIYCCKLGDPTNWNYFSGTSIDSYAATVGSDGVFTGAITYNNNPIFFKEHSFLKVTVSSTGAHSYREQIDRGVQNGSGKSICNVNGVLYYKGVTDVYAYDGSSPMAVGENLGEHRYSDAVCGTIGGRYYMCVTDADGKRILFVYDTMKGLWAKEDNVDVKAFCTNKDNLLMVVDNKLLCVDGKDGTLEKDVEWFAESGYIGFSIAGKKYVTKVNIRMALEMGAFCDMWIQYDDETKWKHLFNMSGKGTRAFTVPVTIQRCDHFRIKLSGKGGCKIYSISKTVEEGSDV